jgi:hypothetical protein
VALALASDGAERAKGIKDGAIRGLVASALREHGTQHALETFQFFTLRWMSAMCFSVMLFTLPHAMCFR